MLRRLLLALFVILAAGGAARAAEPLVGVPWLKEHLGTPGLVVVDVRSPGEYLQAHIPGAVSTDYAKSGWRVDRDADKVPEQLPTDFAPLARHVGELGIDGASHVVLVHGGRSAGEVGAATRIYWTFKLMGHDQVSILDGGFAEWAKDKANPLEAGKVTPAVKVFPLHLRTEMIAREDDVVAAQPGQLVDARSEDFYAGINRSGLAKANGTISGARNLPFTWLTVNAGGAFRKKDQLETLFAVAGVPAHGEQILFCNTGHLASIDWFVSHELLGNAQARLYPGSMTEWTNHGRPVEQKVKLP
ncbi:MAG: sulfurtransferase [Actinomycetota bacterium]